VTSLADAYAATVIEFADLNGAAQRLVPQPEGLIGDWPLAGVAEAWILTAENPRSASLSAVENSARMSHLDVRLTELGAIAVECVGVGLGAGAGVGLGVGVGAGVGQERVPQQADWTENSRLITGLSRETVIALARDYEQNAVFRWAPDALQLVGVLMEMELSRGWALERLSG
jgi:hypothetical protein